MNWFKNMKTVAKLVLGFSVICVLMAGIGYLGLSDMAEINDMLEDLYRNQTVGIERIKEANVQYLSISRAMRNAILEEDEAVIKKSMSDIAKYDENLKKNLAEFKPLLKTAEDQAIFASLEKDYAELKAMVDRVVSLALSHEDKEAREMLAATRAKGDAIDAAMDKLTEHKEKQAEDAEKAAEAVYAGARKLLFAVIVIGIAFGLGFGYFIARMISRPLGEAMQVLGAVAAGDFTQKLDIHTKDEIGEMASSLNKAVEAMGDALQEVNLAAASAASAAEQLTAASEQLASGAQEQASSLEETAASLEEITGTVKQNADNARQANQLALSSREVAEKGGDVVTSAVSAMAEINRSSKKIADIITTIDEIAFQTNLLALNAAVEAARAGEQGRGFAVVAAEVRSLAQRSATAAKEIKALIQDSVQKVDDGSELVDKSGQTLQEIVLSVKKVTNIIGEIAAASQEQSSGIDQVNKAVGQMDQVTQSNSAQTEELSSTAQSLAAQAEQLQALVGRFKLAGGSGAVHMTQVATKPTIKSVPIQATSAKAAGAQPGNDAFHHTESASHSRPADVNGVANGAEKGFEEF